MIKNIKVIKLFIILFHKNKKIIKFINILIFSLFIKYLYKKNKIELKKKEKFFKQLKEFENKQNISQIEIQEFRKINSENILLDITKFKRNNNPDISIIITMYNQGHCIHKCLRSIQNQSLKNLEIIIIDDCSLDNSTDVIEAYQKEDDRIILVKHESNEGKIKTRTDGIKIAKGKYITLIDGDDSFIHENILNNSLYIANLADLDVVEFKGSYYRQGKFKENVNNYDAINITNIVYQPELRTIFFYTKEKDSIRAIQNRSIWGKLIKNKIFQKAIINIGPKYTEDYILTYEDTIMSVAIFQVAQSYYLMNQVGYYYSRDEFSNRFSIQKNKKCKPNGKENKIGQLKLLQFLLEKTRNNELERQMIYHEIISINYYSKISSIINRQFKEMYEIYDTIINSQFISIKQKERIKILKAQLKSKEKK